MDVACLAECFGAGDTSGASGGNIVDYEQMLVADNLAIGEFKDMLYVLVTFPTPLVGLATFEDGAAYGILDDRQSCDLTDTLGYLFTLVIASLS